jgi:carboxyl-terminal processing protease
LSEPGGDRWLQGFATGVLSVAAFAVCTVAVVWLLGGFDSGSGVSTDAQSVIEQNYFHEVKPSLLDNASINGMITTLKHRYDDRFSHYFDPRQYRQFAAANAGQFSGVGLTVNGVKSGLRVGSVLPNSPAKEAGIKPNDVIVAVDGRSLAGVSEDVAVSRVKGPPGTPVTLTIRSGGMGKPHDVHLKRATVNLPVATGHIAQAGPSKVAYVHFATFSSGSHGQLSSEIQHLYSKGAEGLVLDLRGNPGGQVNEAVLCASLFLKKGERVLSTRGRTQGSQVYDAIGNPLPSKPIVVLIDHNTASAAEILASALEEHHLATTVGSQSFGKGTFQKVINLPSGGALDLTVGRYFTANGTSLLGDGITPQVPAPNRPGKPGDEALKKGLSVLAEDLAVQNK